MWLLYLRFDNEGKVETHHVTAANKAEADSVLKLASQHGLTASSKLVEYAFFYMRGTVKPKEVPNSHFYKRPEFLDKWRAAESK